MKIEVNGIPIFYATEVNTPPGQLSEPFEIQAPFMPSPTATVRISHGQDPAWGPIFMMEFDSLELTFDPDAEPIYPAVRAVIPQEQVMEQNTTEESAT